MEHKSGDPRITDTLLRKIATAPDKAGMLEDLFASRLAAGASGKALVEELARCFLQLQAAAKNNAGMKTPSASIIAHSLAGVARSRGVSPDQFYPALIEKLVADPEPAGKPQAKTSAKDRIFDAALEIFSHKGFHSATTDEIAERAGVGKGTLYRYFATKEKLFEELVKLRLDELEGKATSIIDGHDDVLTMISKYIQVYFEFFDRNQHLYRLIVREQLDLGENSPDNYFKRVLRALPRLKRKVYEGTQLGILKDVDFQTVFYGTMGFVHGVIQKWMARDCSYSLVMELPGVLEVLFHGFVKSTGKFECKN